MSAPINTGSDSKIGRWQGAAPGLDQVQPAPKQPNLNKLGDAGGSKDGGKATMPEPIFESRAVSQLIEQKNTTLTLQTRQATNLEKLAAKMKTLTENRQLVLHREEKNLALTQRNSVGHTLANIRSLQKQQIEMLGDPDDFDARIEGTKQATSSELFDLKDANKELKEKIEELESTVNSQKKTINALKLEKANVR